MTRETMKCACGKGLTFARCLLVTPMLLVLWPFSNSKFADRVGSRLIEWADPGMRR